ncbi:MAG: hypothetical protein QM761_03335 [Pseudoxanthomonas sp.]
MPKNPLRSVATVALLAATAACQPPQPPPTEQPPVPKAEAHTELRDAIKAPQDKARAVEDTLQQAADQQRGQIDAAEQ